LNDVPNRFRAPAHRLTPMSNPTDWIFTENQGKKWSMKPACHGVICNADEAGSRLRFMLCGVAAKRFMAQSATSCAEGTLHLPHFPASP